MAAEAKPAAASGVAGEMEVEAYRRLFPVAFLERHLGESVRIDARRLREARPTTVALGAVSSAHGSALVRLGDTVIRPTFLPFSLLCFPSCLSRALQLFDELSLQAMLASVKLEVMSPPAEHSDEGSVGSCSPFPCCFLLPLVFILLLMLRYLCFA
jgi:exosome complex component RRP43